MLYRTDKLAFESVRCSLSGRRMPIRAGLDRARRCLGCAGEVRYKRRRPAAEVHLTLTRSPRHRSPEVPVTPREISVPPPAKSPDGH